MEPDDDNIDSIFGDAKKKKAQNQKDSEKMLKKYNLDKNFNKIEKPIYSKDEKRKS